MQKKKGSTTSRFSLGQKEYFKVEKEKVRTRRVKAKARASSSGRMCAKRESGELDLVVPE